MVFPDFFTKCGSLVFAVDLLKKAEERAIVFESLFPLIVVLSIVVVYAACWHSVGEIHYLKAFYPQKFTFEEAFYASAVELVKVLIVSIPFFFITAIALYVGGCWKRDH